MIPSPLDKSLSQLCGDADLARTLTQSAEALGISFVITDTQGQRRFGPSADRAVSGGNEDIVTRKIEISPRTRGELRIVADLETARLESAGALILELLESAHRCQSTITGMAAEICDNYEELNLVYDLCPQIASKQEPAAIGDSEIGLVQDPPELRVPPRQYHKLRIGRHRVSRLRVVDQRYSPGERFGVGHVVHPDSQYVH